MKEDGEQKADDRGQRSENMEVGMRPALVRLNWYKLLSFRLIVLM